MNIVLVGVLAYILSNLIFGFIVSRRIRNERDFIVAGRRLGPGFMVMTVFATWFGAESCLGAAGESYTGGLAGARADPFGYAIGLMIVGLLVAAPLWKRNLTTLADLFRQRYGLGVSRLAAVVMIPSSVIWAAAEMRAFGSVMSSFSQLQIVFTISIAAAVIITYTTLGGMLADAYSDFLHAIVLIVGLFVLVFTLFNNGAMQALEKLPDAALDFFPPGVPLGSSLEAWAIPILSTIAAQELAAHVISARSPTIARGATITASLIYVSVGLIPVGVGLVAPIMLGAGENPEAVLTHMATHYLPVWMLILFTGALVSAILSTAASAMLVAGALTAHNLVLPFWKGLGDKRKLLVTRIAVVCLGGIAYVMALQGEGVYELVQEASSLGSSGVFICLVFALWGKRIGGPMSASAALIAGLAVYILGHHVFSIDYPYIVSVFTAAVVYVATAFIWPFSASARHHGQQAEQQS